MTTSNKMNTVHIIAPYKYHGQWAFDDEQLGLCREAFVSGADVLMDRIAPPGSEQFVLLFSSVVFPGHTLAIEYVKDEYGGCWYGYEPLHLQLWLCASIYQYFKEPPKIIYLGVKKI